MSGSKEGRCACGACGEGWVGRNSAPDLLVCSSLCVARNEPWAHVVFVHVRNTPAMHLLNPHAWHVLAPTRLASADPTRAQVYAFSCENWGRSASEVGFLMGLLERTLDAVLPDLQVAGRG